MKNSSRLDAEIAKNLIGKMDKSEYEEFVTGIKKYYQIEIDVYKRARNSKVNSHPSNTDIICYKKATGLEAVFGYLYLENKNDRIMELINIIMEEK